MVRECKKERGAGGADCATSGLAARSTPAAAGKAARTKHARDARQRHASLEDVMAARSSAPSVTLARLPLVEAIHEPGGRQGEQRSEKEAEQGVDPDQRDVEGAEAEANPEDAEGAVSFQGVAPEAVISRCCASKIVKRDGTSQRPAARAPA